jgi:hypothetical protein
MTHPMMLKLISLCMTLYGTSSTALRRCPCVLTRAVDNNAEHDEFDDWSSINAAQVVIILQLGGCGDGREETTPPD